MKTRRHFLQLIPAAGVAIAVTNAGAADAPLLSESDPQAKALGYVTDAKRVDKAKFPKYKPPEHCAICHFYQGAATVPVAPCTIFGGKRVDGPGWCSAFAPKPS